MTSSQINQIITRPGDAILFTGKSVNSQSGIVYHQPIVGPPLS